MREGGGGGGRKKCLLPYKIEEKKFCIYGNTRGGGGLGGRGGLGDEENEKISREGNGGICV